MQALNQSDHNYPCLFKKRERDADKPEEEKQLDDLEDARLMDPDDDGSVFKDSTNTRRFSSPSSEKKLREAAKGVVPKNTVNNTRWAENNFLAWAKERNKCVVDDPVPLDLLESQDADLVNKYLCRYILETQRENGSHYPPGTIRSLLSALNRIMQRNKAPFSVFDKNDLRFCDLMHTLDTISSDLHR